MRKKIIKYLIFILIGFSLMFICRLIYGYLQYPQNVYIDSAQNYHTNWRSLTSGKNYASKKYKNSMNNVVSVDQKYEKVATISSKSSNFEQDNEQLRKLITKYNILIQFEQRSGLKGQRRLSLALGVIPDKFELAIADIQLIGVPLSIQIDKSDKTNEYKELNAKKKSLEKTRESLSGLKSQGGKIQELIELETRILQIEEQIQRLGVNLGEFDDENEFCTIKATLIEAVKKTAVNIPIYKRVKVALEWTIKYYLMCLLIVFIGLSVIFLIFSVLNKFKLIEKAIENYNSKD